MSTIISGIHYSNQPNLFVLRGDRSGSGIKGAEERRLRDSQDPRIKLRMYFYNKISDALPQREPGLGSYVYAAKLTNIYDNENATSEERNIIKQNKEKYVDENPSNAFESALLDSGYVGYTNKGMTVMLGQNELPVNYLGKI